MWKINVKLVLLGRVAISYAVAQDQQIRTGLAQLNIMSWERLPHPSGKDNKNKHQQHHPTTPPLWCSTTHYRHWLPAACRMPHCPKEHCWASSPAALQLHHTQRWPNTEVHCVPLPPSPTTPAAAGKVCSPAPQAALNAGSRMFPHGVPPAANSCCQHTVFLHTCCC